MDRKSNTNGARASRTAMVRAAAAVKGSPRMPRDRERRLQVLLDKGNSGTLARGERSELRALLEEARNWTLLALENAAAAVHHIELGSLKGGAGRGGSSRHRSATRAAQPA
jgi:hypothetical protein